MDRSPSEAAIAQFFAELGHRDVYRTAVAYGAGAFVLWQVADIVLPALGFPPSAMTVLVLGAVAGFPVALVLAWLYQVIPDEARRESQAPSRPSGLMRLGRAVPIALGCIALVACGGVAWWVVPHEKMLVAEGTHLLLADFDNQTGDSIFHGSLDSALRVGLAQSPHLSLVPRSGIEAALKQMREPPDAALDERTAREVALRSGVAAVLLPSIARVGDRYRLATRLADPVTDSTVVVRSATARGSDEVLAALDDLVRQLRADLGEPVRSMVAKRAPLDRATTASLEALKAWSEANRHWTSGRQQEAGVLYARAVELDSTFAVAHADLGQFHYWVQGNPNRGAEHMDAALRHSRDVGHRERLVIEGKAAEWRGDREGAIVAYRAMASAYPRDPLSWGNLGYQYLRLERQDEAIEAYERVVELDSLSASAWLNLATLYNSKAELDTAVTLYEKAFDLAPSYRTVNNINHEYGFMLLDLGRTEEAEETFRLLLEGEAGQRAHGLRSIALLRIREGRPAEAVEHLRQAVVLTRASESYVSELRNRAYLLQALRLAGEPVQRQLQEARKLAIDRTLPSYFISFIGSRLAEAGRLEAAREVLDSARARLDDGRESRMATERLAAEIAAAKGDTTGAVEHFRTALAHNPDALGARHGLGMLLLARGDTAAAEAELTHLVEPARLTGDETLVPRILSHYQLGRIFEASGRHEEAARSYSRFLDYWGAGDSGLPGVADARERLTELRGSSLHSSGGP